MLGWIQPRPILFHPPVDDDPEVSYSPLNFVPPCFYSILFRKILRNKGLFCLYGGEGTEPR